MTKNRRRAIAIAAAVVLLLAALAAILPFTPALQVKNIAVDGAQHTSAEEVADASGVALGTPMGRVDTHAAAVGVAGLPWVKSVTARRQWPSTLQIAVEEHVAVAYVVDGEGSHLIDASGERFAVDTPPEGAVEITGDAARDDQAASRAVDVVASISEAVRGEVASVEAPSPYVFVLHLRDDKTVVWGASEDNANKALALETVLQRDGAEFNLSSPGQITVR